MAEFEPTIIQTYAEIPRSGVRLLWHCDFWDGPLSGMLLYQSEMCWYAMIVENEDDGEKWYRRFAVIRLTSEQAADEQYWHDQFRQHVGTHTDYGDDERRTPGAVLPQQGWDAFYDRYNERPKPNYSGNLILGWFEL
jgi:hypothetical protein